MENRGQSFAQLYHQALVNPKELSLDDFQLLISKYPYSQPLHFALERRKFQLGELNKLGNTAILLAGSPNWLYEYVQLPVKVEPYADVVDNDYVPYDDTEQSIADTATVGWSERALSADSEPEAQETAAGDDDVVAPQAYSEANRDESPAVSEVTESATIDSVPSSSTAQDTLREDAALPEEETSKEETSTEEVSEEDNQVLETLVQEGIGGGDYFALHHKEIRWEPESDPAEAAAEEVETQSPSDEDEVSLYNDELMPYSFRWWLHKTRLEYADTYQPFASPYLPTNKKSAFDPVAFDKIVLDQQIRENIIHLQQPEDKLSDEVKQRPVTYTRVDKTSEAIEKFIREEPQIQPPPADQLNMENKARKSSEEQFDLVTETLAGIYAGQAMYVKAIEVYKKLILRYPEKKSYFASQIKELEEKLY